MFYLLIIITHWFHNFNDKKQLMIKFVMLCLFIFLSLSEFEHCYMFVMILNMNSDVMMVSNLGRFSSTRVKRRSSRTTGTLEKLLVLFFSLPNVADSLRTPGSEQIH